MIYTITLNPGLDRTLTVGAIRDNEVLRATASRLDWGGKGFNVARGLHALGQPSTALGLVGGYTGQMLAEGLHDLGIATDFVTVPGETRTNTVIAEAHSSRYIKVNEAGPTVPLAALETVRGQVRRLATPGSYWAICGSLPPGVPYGFYAELVTLIQGAGGHACLDAGGAALRLGCAAAPFLVKPNVEEAHELTGIVIGGFPAAQQAAAYFLAQGVQIVALSLGAEGMLLATRAETIHARPPQVAVRTLVGVGDALLAGVLDALAQAVPLIDAARWGSPRARPRPCVKAWTWARWGRCRQWSRR
ncbi:MAG: 1-phosphofructokinase family hexose kinase [Caldilineaceae bacterium]|nr:1-phosphofructokinase family hexose kinase [Caldilineaceae bacterium]